jgi:hypothetical protein
MLFNAITGLSPCRYRRVILRSSIIGISNQ